MQPISRQSSLLTPQLASTTPSEESARQWPNFAEEMKEIPQVKRFEWLQNYLKRADQTAADNIRKNLDWLRLLPKAARERARRTLFEKPGSKPEIKVKSNDESLKSYAYEFKQLDHPSFWQLKTLNGRMKALDDIHENIKNINAFGTKELLVQFDRIFDATFKMSDINESDGRIIHQSDVLIALLENMQDMSILRELLDRLKHLPNRYQIFDSFLAQGAKKQATALRLLPQEYLEEAVHIVLTQVKLLKSDAHKIDILKDVAMALREAAITVGHLKERVDADLAKYQVGSTKLSEESGPRQANFAEEIKKVPREKRLEWFQNFLESADQTAVDNILKSLDWLRLLPKAAREYALNTLIEKHESLMPSDNQNEQMYTNLLSQLQELNKHMKALDDIHENISKINAFRTKELLVQFHRI